MQEVEEPAASVAVQVIVVGPGGKGSASGFPSDRLPVTATDEQLPLTVGVLIRTWALHSPASISAKMLSGQVRVGGAAAV